MTEAQAAELLSKMELVLEGIKLILSDAIPYIAGCIVGGLTALGVWLVWK